MTAFVPNPVWEALKLRVMSPFWELLSGFSVGVMFSLAQPANSSAASVKNHDFMNSVGNLESKCYLCVEIILEE